MRVYIAAPFSKAEDVRSMGEYFLENRVVSTSEWINFKAGHSDPKYCATLDLFCIEQADALVLLNPTEWAGIGRGGRHFESGYALALGKPVIVCGELSSVFHHLHGKVWHCPSMNPDDILHMVKTLLMNQCSR